MKTIGAALGKKLCHKLGLVLRLVLGIEHDLLLRSLLGTELGEAVGSRFGTEVGEKL